ncbi:MAG: c-type cytochrome [Gemmatimonadetes bacterium]|nr:c-type cytochrome [Gemmatimonadota bacterium]
MKTALKVVGALLGIALLCAGGLYAWASIRTTRMLTRIVDTHQVDFPIPFPLTEAEIAELASPDSARAVALARAIERGRHLVDSRYVCTECHGANFGGGVMIDDPAIGTALGPNITGGFGSRVWEYDTADWDRTIRHGVGPSGRPLVMPAEDFQLMSDQELSDVVAYVKSVPPVENEVPAVTLGPLGKVLLALGEILLAADVIPSHTAPHSVFPPASEATVEFGRHLSGVCTGCHRPDFSGGPIPGGDPSWPPAKNLTPHESALGSWSFDDFARSLREGTRPDGTGVLEPMAAIVRYTRNMSDTEVQAIWNCLQTVPAVPVE